MRPIFHQKGENIEAHLNLAVLAYFIVSFIRHKLKQKNISHRWLEIVRIMSTQKCSINTIMDSNEKTIVLKTCSRAQLKTAAIYAAMKYKAVPYYRKKYIWIYDFLAFVKENKNTNPFLSALQNLVANAKV